MNTKNLKKVIFLDVDGVMNNYTSQTGSYMTHSPEQYGVSEENFSKLMKLIEDTGAKVIISSNWRKFSEDPASPFYFWNNPYTGLIPNPLPKLKERLGCAYAGELPKDRHITKAEALELWFEDTGFDWKELKYVIFDDDDREGYAESKFSKHFIKTCAETGLVDEDCERAKEILNI